MFRKGHTPHNKGKSSLTMWIEHGRRVIKFADQSRCYYARHLMEESIRRKLHKNEQVHHIDGNSLNDDLSNLAIMDIREHTSLHSTGKKYPERQRKVKKNCLTCGGGMMVKPSKLERTKFCSLECKNTFQKSNIDIKTGRFKKWVLL